MVSYIYLIESITDYEHVYKIGYTKNKNIKNRLRTLKTGNHGDVKVVYMFETKHERKVELAMQQKYYTNRLNGEWFDIDLEDVVNFEKNCQTFEKGFDIMKEYNNPYY